MINTLFVFVLQRWERNLERIGKNRKKSDFLFGVFVLCFCNQECLFFICKYLFELNITLFFAGGLLRATSVPRL